MLKTVKFVLANLNFCANALTLRLVQKSFHHVFNRQLYVVTDITRNRTSQIHSTKR